MIPRILATAVIAFMGALVAVSAGAETTLEKAKRTGSIIIGYANEAPYGFTTPDGKLTGEAPEIAKHVLAKMGVNNVEGVITEFGSLIPGLKAGRFDIIAAGMFVLPKRCKQVNFSEPTYGIGQAFLVKAGNPKGLNNYDDVAKNSDAKLAVMAGAVEGDYAKKSGVPRAQVLVLPDPAAGMAAVKSGRADALALTSLAIGRIVEAAGPDSGLERAKPFSIIAGEFVKGHGGFGFRKEDADLLAAFNEQLKPFIGTKEHLELIKPFGFTEGELPERTTAELCKG
jgi:polar amino acid transport system substrate-binding protein